MNHLGIYLSNTADKNAIINGIFSNEFLKNTIDLSIMRGELFSTITINKVIEEELLHDKFVISTRENATLQSMSDGQRRKALLTYLIEKKPDYVVLDDLFGSIDNETLQFVLSKLNQIESATLLIQLFFRKQDVLPFISTVFTVDGQNQVIAKQSRSDFLEQKETEHHMQFISLPELFTKTNETINPLIQLNSVSANYGDKLVLKDINWTIRTGEFWQLKGPIGSGKTTLLSMIIGDNPRGFGEDMILFGKKKGTGETIWDIKRRIGYFTPNMTHRFTHDDSVEHMIISGLVDSVGLYTKPSDLQKNIASAWLKVLGPSFHKKHFNSLSFGQQRILMVVRALVKHPPLLILDEPTVGLDDENAKLFINLITTIASQRKIAIIYVSHRTEPELKPDKIFELKPTPEGSEGTVIIGSLR